MNRLSSTKTNTTALKKVMWQLGVCITADTKRAVVVKEDDLLSKKDFAPNVSKVITATASEIRIRPDNSCFKMSLVKDARNVMTSRYVAKWKKINDKDGKITRVI